MIRIDVKGGGSAERADGDAEPIRIGRSPGNDLVLEAAHVSSEHARVVWSGERFLLQDLRSTNGTVIMRRGERVKL
ncbi:MAG: FHA domain-containing protein, partial [Polyangiales bacterium]